MKSDRAIYGKQPGVTIEPHLLCKACLEGKMVPRDNAEAVHWLTKSAEQETAMRNS